MDSGGFEFLVGGILDNVGIADSCGTTRAFVLSVVELVGDGCSLCPSRSKAKIDCVVFAETGRIARHGGTQILGVPVQESCRTAIRRCSHNVCEVNSVTGEVRRSRTSSFFAESHCGSEVGLGLNRPFDSSP